MSPRRLFLPVAAALALVVLPSAAQTDSSAAAMSFEEFRNSLRQSYDEFRNRLIEDYATFLDGIWEDFEMHKPIERKPEPKPVEPVEVAPDEQLLADAPLVKLPEPTVSPAAFPPARPDMAHVSAPASPAAVPSLPRDPHAGLALPDASAGGGYLAANPAAPASPAAVPSLPRDPHAGLALPDASAGGGYLAANPAAPASPAAVPSLPRDPHSPISVPDVTIPVVPVIPAALPGSPVALDIPLNEHPLTTADDDDDLADGFIVPFYGMEIAVPDADFTIFPTINDRGDYARQWNALKADDVAARFLPGFKSVASRLGLNDYLSFALLNDYARARFPEASAASRLSLVHYLLVNLGYDARIGVSSGDGKTLLALPVEQEKLYGRIYIEMDGKNYYVFSDDLAEDPDIKGYLSSCRIPADLPRGENFDLALSGLRLPYKPHPYKIEYGGIKLEGEVNANIFPVVYRYPQMPMADFARSEIDAGARRDIVDQLKTQFAGRKGITAVNDLLHFVQDGYQYATDQEQHGFEKPYFVEEMLYYDTCDCEDRANFYCYLLWNVLGVENHLLAYPGHESAAVVSLEPPRGVTYIHDSKVFMISDPTYIGSMTGMCMPQYSSTRPEIDYIYK